MLGHPARDALAHPRLDLLRRLAVVLLVVGTERDGDEVLAFQAIDPDVVVLDELAQLRGDHLADLGNRREAIEPRPQLLDRLELRRPACELAVLLRGPDGDRRLGREGRHRVELSRRPFLGPIVIQVEDPDGVVALEQRRRTDRVEPLLHDGGPQARHARVVPVAGCVDGPTRGHGVGRNRRPGEIAQGRDVRGRQPTGDLGDDMAVALADEDGGPVGAEEDHRMVHQAGQRLVDVERSVRIRRDAAQGFRPVELATRLVEKLEGVHGPAQQPGGYFEPLELLMPLVQRSVKPDDEHAPVAGIAGNRQGHFRAAAPRPGGPVTRRCERLHDRGPGRERCRRGAGGKRELAHVAEAAVACASDQAIAGLLPDRDVHRADGSPDQARRGMERAAEVLAAPGERSEADELLEPWPRARGLVSRGVACGVAGRVA